MITVLQRPARAIAAFVTVVALVSLGIGLHQISIAYGSVDPAPASQTRRALTDVHTDAVSSYLDDGVYVLATKADVDGEIGKRLDTAATSFVINDGLIVDNPTTQVDDFNFLADYPERFWMAPQTQKAGSLWPGFSTEDDAFSRALGEASVSLTLTDVDGPGRVEVFVGGGFSGVQRFFSSVDDLPAWTMTARQHTHANWAFSQPGVYRLTFQGRAVLNGQEQTAEQTYRFVVGDQAAIAQPTSLSITAQQRSIAGGGSVILDAEVTPADAEGYVVFLDAQTGQILGHEVVEQGQARFTSGVLTAGLHILTARFVPVWTDDYEPSSVPGVDGIVVEVAGEASVKPVEADTDAPTGLDITHAGDAVKITTQSPTPGSGVSVTIPDYASRWVSLWITDPEGKNPLWQGWMQVNPEGELNFALPSNLEKLVYIVAKDADGTVIGFDQIDRRNTDSADSDQTNPSEPSNDTTTNTGNNNAGGSGDAASDSNAPAQLGTTSASTSNAQVPAQICSPDVVIDHGHTDAFTVSVANGKAVLQIKEDVTGAHVMREAESVLYKVKEDAYSASIPAGFPGSPSGYVLPLAQNPSLVWPGWDTNGTAQSGYSNVRIDITSVEGPGQVYLYSFGSFGGVTPVLMNGATRLPASIHVPKPAHVHAQWVFTQKGIYKLTVSARAENADGNALTTATHTYVFQVGDIDLGDTFCHVAVSAQARADANEVQTALGDQTRAAVEQDKANAVEQAEAPDSITGTADDRETGNTTVAKRSEIAESLGLVGVDPMLLGTLIGAGTALILVAIAAGTVFYVRHMKHLADQDQ